LKAPWAPTLPKCSDCGGRDARVVSKRVRVGVPGVEVDSHEWLCASCEYKRAHPDAAPAAPAAPLPLPRERRPLPLQDERLW
jgi:hypothetical protein